jgi:hypothetical protein
MKSIRPYSKSMVGDPVQAMDTPVIMEFEKEKGQREN